MFSRALFRSSTRALPQAATPRVLPRPPIRPLQRYPSLTSWRFESNWGRFPPPPPPRRPNKIVHYRYDPNGAQNAKPLITTEQIRNAFLHTRTKWIVAIGCGGFVLFYVSHLETVPVSGRRRFNCYSDESVEAEAKMMYNMIMQQAGNQILPDWDPRVRMVRRVMQRLIPASGMEGVDWEVNVIHSPEKNAFVIPGGKVFVYSGILPIASTDDGLAAILGHEIAHNLARHQAESMSSSIIYRLPLTWLFIALDATGYTMGLGRIVGEVMMELGVARPAGRKQESEADFIGLMMMARSCYDPSAAVGVWQRMQAANSDEIPEWLSTHPSNSNRIEKMRSWLPQAEEARSESECASTMTYAHGFKSAMSDWGGFGMFR